MKCSLTILMLATLIASLIIAIGILGCLLPVLPGTVIAFVGIALHKLLLGEASVSWSFVLVALGITVLSIFIDIWCTWWGARRFGASWKGALGAVLGAIAGFLFFSLPGLIIGPVVGAILFELMDDRSGPEALAAGVGTIVGSLMAFFLKFGMTAAMGIGFFMAILAH